MKLINFTNVELPIFAPKKVKKPTHSYVTTCLVFETPCHYYYYYFARIYNTSPQELPFVQFQKNSKNSKFWIPRSKSEVTNCAGKKPRNSSKKTSALPSCWNDYLDFLGRPKIIQRWEWEHLSFEEGANLHETKSWLKTQSHGCEGCSTYKPMWYKVQRAFPSSLLYFCLKVECTMTYSIYYSSSSSSSNT